MKALLEIDMPRSCINCVLCEINHCDGVTWGAYCIPLQKSENLVDKELGFCYETERHPCCPLKPKHSSEFRALLDTL